MGRPVLISNKVNIWREIEADGAGMVVNDDVDAVAAGLREMCGLSAERREEIGNKARLCFLERYDLERNAMDLLMLISKVAGRAAPEREL